MGWLRHPVISAGGLIAAVIYLSAVAAAQHQHHSPQAAASFFENLLKVYTPRRVCMFHEAPVIWLHVISDALIAVAYYSIPLALIYFVRRRKDVAFSWVYWLFAFFILACGTTHAIGVLDVWMPFYKVDGIAKAITASFSVATAIALWPLMPKALGMASPAQLEQTVKERTSELLSANEALSAREQAIRESENQLSAFFENSAVGASQLDTNGRFVRVNRRLCEIIGYSREELLGASVFDLSHPHDKERDAEYFRRFMAEESSSYNIEKRLVRKDGHVIWIQTASGLVRDADGRPWRSATITQDITERKEAEEALRGSERKLRESEERFRVALQSSNTGWWRCDLGTSTFEADAQVGQLLGVTNSNQLALEQFVDHIHPDDRPAFMEKFAAVRTGAGDYEIEFRTNSNGGLPRWILMRGRAFEDNGRGPTHAMGIALDISERKRLENELRAATHRAIQAKESAERANSAKDQFLAVLSHELRTPLAPVLSAVNLIERSDPSPAIREPLEVILRNVQLEARLIDDLLDLTKIVRGKISLDLQPVDIRTVLERVIEVCSPEFEARNIRFEKHGFDQPLVVDADAARLQQIFWNLLKNAVKFSLENGSITLNSRQEGETIITEVTDSGIGIEAEALERIFEAFEQANAGITKQFGGLGLGLAISRKLVVMHGGSISAHSTGKGGGSSFRVLLPAASPERAARDDQQAGRRPPVRPYKILLVEDHADTARMMRALLEAGGYEVLTAPTAAEALEQIRSMEFDLLISDIGLPDGSGIDLMEEVHRLGKRLRGIALSGFGREEDIACSKEAGFAEHLTKPIDFDALGRAIERVLRPDYDVNSH